MNIFDELENDWHHLASHLHHHQATPAYHHNQTTQGDDMSELADVYSVFGDAVGNIKGWIEQAEEKLPALAKRAARDANSPIAAELEKLGELVLPPEIVESVTGLIQMGGRLAAAAATTVASVAAPAEAVALAEGDASTPAESEQPAEAQPAAQ